VLVWVSVHVSVKVKCSVIVLVFVKVECLPTVFVSLRVVDAVYPEAFEAETSLGQKLPRVMVRVRVVSRKFVLVTGSKARVMVVVYMGAVVEQSLAWVKVVVLMRLLARV
jgi:hypothetical protein